MRSVYLRERDGVADIPVFDGEAIGAGATFNGPCLLETPTFTALLKDGHRAQTDEFGNFLVEVA
jgi:N-methylhydantoinase A